VKYGHTAAARALDNTNYELLEQNIDELLVTLPPVKLQPKPGEYVLMADAYVGLP